MIRQLSFILYKKNNLLAIVLLSFSFVFFLTCCSSPPIIRNNIKETVFTKLGKIREEKKSKVLNYLRGERKVAENISKNKEIIGYFKNFYQLYHKGELRGNQFTSMQRKIEEFYAYQLENFYDVLFIDNSGEIFSP